MSLADVTSNLRAPVETATDSKPMVKVHAVEWAKIMAGEPVEINPSVGHGYKIMSVKEWAARWKQNEAYPECLVCGSHNTKEHHFTQTWCRGKKKWESETVCLDCHSFSKRSYSDPDFKTPEEYDKDRWQITCQPQPVLSFTKCDGARSLAPPLAAAASEAAPAPSGGLGQAIKVTAYIGLWYGFNIVFNILNKTVLNSFPAPWFVSAFQLLASAVFMILLWVTRLYPAPEVNWRVIRELAPVALFHTIGHVSACVSFSLMAVSFAHVVKAAEPVLSVGLSQLILGEINPWYVWASLLPIIGGCSLSAMKEVSFAWGGFNNAMISNFGMVMRNVYSKKSLSGATNKLDGINLFALLSIISFFYTLPVAIAVEGFRGGVWQWGPLWNQAVATLGQAQFYKLMAAAGLFYHLYNQASYMVLDQGISPVTFSVGNTMKRVAVVVSSVLFFRNPVSAMNWVGSLLAIAGTGLYSMAKQKASNDAKKAKQA